MKYTKYLFIAGILGLITSISCTKLKENVLDQTLGTNVVTDTSNLDGLISPPYASLRHLDEWFDYWGLQQICTDETCFPTRGTDWDDNGAWRQQYLHTWTPDHIRTNDVWNVLGQGFSRANTAIYYIGLFPQTAKTKQYIAEARFLRAYYMYLMVDLYGVGLFRDPSDFVYSKPPQLMDRKTATDFIISELKAIKPDLKTRAQVTSARVNKSADDALLAKIYLNYKVYTGTASWANAKAYCDTIINSGQFAIASDYWSMFQADTYDDPEFILQITMSDKVDMGSGSVWVNFTLHYNQVFGTYTSFWNGGCTTADFINTFDSINDARFRDDRIRPTTGINQGFLIGQQYSINGTALTDRNGNPLIFTPNFSLTSSNETMGVRVVKFAPDPQTQYQFNSPNNFPLFRISEIYLARAEAELQLGDAASALADVNAVRSKRSKPGKILPLLTSVTLDDIYKERGFELYWEGYHRQDMIRFGKFTGTWQEKPTADPDSHTTIYPIPTSARDLDNALPANGYTY